MHRAALALAVAAGLLGGPARAAAPKRIVPAGRDLHPSAPAAPSSAPVSPDTPLESRAPDADALRRVRALLSAYEHVPLGTQLDAIGPELGPALLALAADRDVHPLLRARAVTLLGERPVPGVAELSEALLADAAAEPILRRKAAWALAKTAPTRAAAALEAAYRGAGPRERLLREHCARALILLGPGAEPTRRALLHGERDPFLRTILLESNPETIQRAR